MFVDCSAILALGFDEKFIRVWEYYFIYCAAGFKSRTLGTYQVTIGNPFRVVGADAPTTKKQIFKCQKIQNNFFAYTSRHFVSAEKKFVVKRHFL